MLSGNVRPDVVGVRGLPGRRPSSCSGQTELPIPRTGGWAGLGILDLKAIDLELETASGEGIVSRITASVRAVVLEWWEEVRADAGCPKRGIAVECLEALFVMLSVGVERLG